MSQNDEENTDSRVITANLKDLSCPICYVLFGGEKNLPVTLHCGHTVCSACLARVDKCPLCKMPINKQQMPQKAVVLCSMIAGIKTEKRCKDHMMPYEGFCVQDKSFLCFDCLLKEPKDPQNIVKIKEINKKAKKLGLETKKISDKEKSRRLEIRQSLDEVNRNLKRRIDERYKHEIEEFSLAQKRLYKDVDLVILTEKDHYEHKLLSENLVKYCKSTETVIENWNTQEEENLVLEILDNPLEKIPQLMNIYDKNVNSIKGEILQKETRYMQGLTGNLLKDTNFLTDSIEPTHSKEYSKIELDYLIEVFKAYNMKAVWNQNNQRLLIQITDFSVVPPQFNQIVVGFFWFRELSLKCFEMPSFNIYILCQILKNALVLQDLTLHLEKISDEDLNSLSGLFINSRLFMSKFSVSMDFARTTEVALKKFFDLVTCLPHLSSFKLLFTGMRLVITIQLARCSSHITRLENMCIVIEDVPPLLFESFCWLLNSSRIAQVKSLKTLKIALGEKEKDSKLSSSLCRILQAQKHLEELKIIIFKDSSFSSEDHLLKLLPSALGTRNNLKKLEIAVFLGTQETAKHLDCIPEFNSLMLQNLEELTLNIGCSKTILVSKIIWNFLLLTRRLKKFTLRFIGEKHDYQVSQRWLHEILKKQNLKLYIELADFAGMKVIFSSSEQMRDYFNRHSSYVSSDLASGMARPSSFPN